MVYGLSRKSEIITDNRWKTVFNPVYLKGNKQEKEITGGLRRWTSSHLDTSLGASLNARCKRFPEHSSQRSSRIYPFDRNFSKSKSLHLVPNPLDLWSQVTSIVRGNGGRDNRPGWTACSTNRGLIRHKHIWDVSVFAKQRKMHHYRERNSVGSHNDDFGCASAHGLRDWANISSMVSSKILI